MTDDGRSFHRTAEALDAATAAHDGDYRQSTLIVQGHDPGKPDGLMGPKTMLALLAWSAASGPSWDGNDERSYRWGLDGNVAHLLHGTLEVLELSPRPQDRFLRRENTLEQTTGIQV